MISGDTPAKERSRIIEDFKSGRIKSLPTMSLAMWYQIVGRAIRPHPDKEAGWVVDLCGNIKRFGMVENLRLIEPKPGQYVIQGVADNQYKQLTNCYF